VRPPWLACGAPSAAGVLRGVGPRLQSPDTDVLSSRTR